MALAITAPSAAGATLGVDGDTAVYKAKSGEVNRLRQSYVPGVFFAEAFTDYTSPVKLGAGCVAGSPIVCSALPVTVHLGDMNDIASVVPFFEEALVYGGDGDDDLFADGQPGIADGGTGDDVIRVSGNGSARANGGPGDDEMAGGSEACSFLDGGDGKDLIVHTGGICGDSSGQSGDDRLVGRAVEHGGATLAGNADDDVITFLAESARGGNWTFDGGRGGDVISGPAGHVDAGPGDDRISVVGGEAASNVTCGNGYDVVWADSTDVVASDCEKRLVVTDAPQLPRVADAVADAQNCSRTSRSPIPPPRPNAPKAQRSLR